MYELKIHELFDKYIQPILRLSNIEISEGILYSTVSNTCYYGGEERNKLLVVPTNSEKLVDFVRNRDNNNFIIFNPFTDYKQMLFIAENLKNWFNILLTHLNNDIDESTGFVLDDDEIENESILDHNIAITTNTGSGGELVYILKNIATNENLGIGFNKYKQLGLWSMMVSALASDIVDKNEFIKSPVFYKLINAPDIQLATETALYQINNINNRIKIEIRNAKLSAEMESNNVIIEDSDEIDIENKEKSMEIDNIDSKEKINIFDPLSDNTFDEFDFE